MATYSDILFGKIVIKNGLAPAATVQECLQIQETSRARGVVMALPEIMVARAAITEEQARLASRAQALTQLQRAEAIYAKIANERGLVAVPVLQELFAVQKQRRFTVRVSQLLLERRLITPEQNDEIMEEQIVRLGEETRLQEEAGLAGSNPLMEDSRVQKMQAEQARLQDLGASTFRSAMPPRFPGASQSTQNALGRSGSGGPRPSAPPPPRPMPARPTPPPPSNGAEEEDPETVLGRTMELDVPPGAFVPQAPVAVDDLKNWPGGPSSSSRGSQAGAKAAPVDPANLTGKTISSRYRILEKLGEGGMGTVYKAEHCLMEKIVAFKVLHPHLIANKQSLERFRREVRAASKFQHKNVIQIYDAGEGEGGIFYMAMEFAEGTSLDALLKNGPLPIERTVLILRQVLKAVGEAHKKGIVHRDLKSENIMITKDKGGGDLVKVMDFGIAKVLDDAQQTGDGEGDGAKIYKTMEGVITGTPQYMSPEQAEGKKVDHRADLYSLGVIIFEMVTGELPFKSETAMGYLGKHIVEDPPRPTVLHPELGIPPEIERIVMRLLEKEPDKRFQSADEIFDQLEAKVTGQYLDVRPAEHSLSGEEVSPRAVRAPDAKGPPVVLILVVAFAIFLVVAVLGVVAVTVKPGGRDKDVVVGEALKAAEDLRAAGKLKEALARLDEGLAAVPGDARLAKARKEVAALAEGPAPDDARARAGALAKEAESALSAGDRPSVERAIRALEEATKLVPDDAALADRLEKARAELKRVSQAETAARARTLLAQAAKAREASDLEGASRALNEARTLVSGDADLELEGKRLAAAVAYAEYGKAKGTDRARDLLAKAIEVQPDEAARTRWQGELKELDAAAKPPAPPPDPRPPAVPPTPDPPKGPTAAELAEKQRAFASALDRARDALAPGLDLVTAGAALDEAALLAPVLGPEAEQRLATRKACAAALEELRPKLDGTRAELRALSEHPKDPNVPRRLEAARAQIETSAKAIDALADLEVAKLLVSKRIEVDRELAGHVRDALPKPGDVSPEVQDALKRWQDGYRRFRDVVLPDLEGKRDAEKIVASLDALKANPARKSAPQADQDWVRDALDRYSLRRKAWAKIPDHYVLVRGGAYALGKTGESKTLDDYFIDANECTQDAWGEWLSAAGDAAVRPQGFKGSTDDPVSGVSGDEVNRFAAWLTKRADGLVTFRLPTEWEWEKAARGAKGLDYPWAATFTPNRDEGRAALGGQLARVRSFEANDLGLFDTVGNVAELTGTVVKGQRVVKGGSAMSPPARAAASERDLVEPSKERTRFTGFRLVAVEKK